MNPETDDWAARNPTAGSPAIGTLSPDVSEDDPRVIRALEEYLADCERGHRPDRRRFLEAHAEIADALASCLDGLCLVRSAAGRLGTPGRDPVGGLAPRTVLGDFRIVREVGRGGMGVVYEAEQVSLGRRVALKILPSAAALDPRQRLRFQNEAHAAAALHHPHIVPVFAVGCEGGAPYYAMQFIEGQSLAELIGRLRRLDHLERAKRAAASPEFAAAPGGPPADAAMSPDSPTTLTAPSPSPEPITPGGPTGSPAPPPTCEDPSHSLPPTLSSARGRAYFRQVAALGIQAADALEHAHEQGVIHRDIKPSNLLLDRRGDLFVADFGLARIRDDAGPTVTGDLVGTLRYMSPEQAMGRPGAIDHRADVYSLGATLYELLTLRPVFDGRDRRELLRQVANDEPRPPRRVNKAIPRDLETIVLKAMAKEPAGRYGSARELGEDLKRFLDDRPILGRRPGLTERSARWAVRHRLIVGAAAVVLALSLAGLIAGNFLLLRERQRNEFNLINTFKALERYDHYMEQVIRRDPDREGESQELMRANLGVYESITRRNPSSPAARWVIAQAYHRVGDIRVSMQQDDEAEAAYQRAVELLAGLERESPANPDYRELRANVLLHLADRSSRLGKADEAMRRTRDSLAIFQVLAVEHPGQDRYRQELGRVYNVLATRLYWQGSFPQQESALRRAMDIQKALVERSPGSADARFGLAEMRINLGDCFRLTNRPAQAEQAFREAIRELRSLAEGHPADSRYEEKIASAHMSLCCPLIAPPDKAPEKAKRHYGEALAAFQRLVRRFKTPAHHQNVAMCQGMMGSLLQASGHPAEAEPFYRAAVATMEGLVEDHSRVARYREQLAGYQSNLAALLLQSGSHAEEGAKLLRESWRGLPMAPATLNNMAWLLVTCPDPRGRDAGLAAEMAGRAVARAPKDAAIRNTLGIAQLQAGDSAAARLTLEESIRLGNGGGALDSFPLAIALHRLGEESQARRRFDRGVAQASAEAGPNAEPALRLFHAEAAAELGLPGPDDRRPVGEGVASGP